MTKELVSIIIRTKNEEKWISSCLSKIFEQNYKKIEVIIVDNNSKDKTVERAKNFPVKIIKINKFKPGKAINLGVKKAKGKYIVCLSAHCIPINLTWLENLIIDLKSKKVAGVYGRQQPLPYSSDFDKRDLLTVFGIEKKIQKKETFFHNANSAFSKEIWKKFPFDELTTNIEDRIWGQKVINSGYKIIYEPKASVFHWHGIHQDMDPQRCSNVVKILESLDKNLYDKSIKSNNKNKTVAILPIRGKSINIDGKTLLERTIENLKNSKNLSGIYVTTDKKENLIIAKKLKVKSPFLRPKNLSTIFTDLLSVSQYTLQYLEEKKIFPDQLLILTEQYPFRPKKFADDMIQHYIKNGFDTLIASKYERAGIWTSTNNKYENIIDGLVPNKLRGKKGVITYIGLGFITSAANLRNGNIYSGKLGFYNIENPLISTDIKNKNDYTKIKNSLKKFNEK